MNYVSLFSGIGGFDLGFDRAGMTCISQVERDAAAASVLSRHWPDVARFDDVCTFGKDSINGSVDLICGGFPCQDLSVAGRRAGLAGERSGLWFEFARIVGELRPQWVVIENVPGLLSSNGGRDFAVILHGLGQFGYLSAWRVLDAQYFGVAQRRRRVFVVASLGDGRAAQILFESDSVRRDSAPRREEGARIAGTLESRARTGGYDPGAHGAASGHLIAQNVAATLKNSSGRRGYNLDDGAPLIAYGGNNTTGPIGVATACNAHGGSGRMDFESETFVYQCHGSNVGPMGTLRQGNGDVTGGVPFVFEPRFVRNGRGAPDTIAPPLKAENGNTGKGDGAPMVAFDTLSSTAHPPAIAFHHRASASRTMNPSEISPSLDKSKEPAAMTAHGVRRLMPVECERLQGFPDGWTAGQSDSARYRQTGNAVAVPVAEWIGRRIMEANQP